MANTPKAEPRLVEDLPFVSDQNFWNVTPTGGYQEDWRTGARYAGLLVRWTVRHAHGGVDVFVRGVGAERGVFVLRVEIVSRLQ